MSKLIPIIDLDGGFASTLDINLAMTNNYIGEIPINPKLLAFYMGEIFGKHYKSFTVFYYGAPDERLKKLFGYEDEK